MRSRSYFSIALLLAITLLFSLSATNVFAQDHKDHKGHKDATTVGKEQTLCPILGGEINKEKKAFADYKGKRIYFCCPGCDKEFNKDPEKYVKKMEAEGIKLEDAPADKK